MVVLSVLFLLGPLFHCRPAEAQSSTIETLKEAALNFNEPLPCNTWDCNCAFNNQRGCCCAANDMFQLEEETFMRTKNVWDSINTLKYRVQELTDGVQVAFKASNITISTSGSTEPCFGPFNINVPIPYSSVTLNRDNGYNPSLGIFTAPSAGVYVFSFTVYSQVEKNGRLYHKVQLMKNGQAIVSVWENNREDNEDNANQVVILELQRGDQVYTELMSGRKLCKFLGQNVFTGYILYPNTDEYNK